MLYWRRTIDYVKHPNGRRRYMILFQVDNYSITIHGQTIDLLRKEYLLLKYLYMNANKALSRNHILEGVWPLQSPSDRTVDDHIYRLRKKLKPYRSFLTIETMKGYGYCLRINNTYVTNEETHLRNDVEIQSLYEQLISKYHLYGNGQAVRNLLDEKVFTVQMEESIRARLSFFNGDFSSLLKNKDLPIKEKSFCYLSFYALVNTDPYYNYGLLKRYIEKGFIDEKDLPEVYLLSSFMYLQLSHSEQACLLLKEKDAFILNEENGFYGFQQLWWLMYALYIKDDLLTEEKIAELHQFLDTKSYQRERGLFSLLKGFYYIQLNKEKQALDSVQQCFTILEREGFPLHILLSINIGELLLSVYSNFRLKELLKYLRETYETNYHTDHYKEKIKQELLSCL